MGPPPGEQRRANARQAPTDASRRADAQAHMDARQARLQAYADSLAAALAAGPRDDRRAELESQLAQTQRDVLAAARRRVPREKAPSRASATQPAPAQPPDRASDAT